MNIEIPKDHPRAKSLRTREKLIQGLESRVVAQAGLIAHGRGEAFDYLLGERTVPAALNAIKAASALLLSAENPVISVNGNAAMLTPEAIVELAETVNAKVEVNLFYRDAKREEAIKNILKRAGAKSVYGIDSEHLASLSELGSERRKVDTGGILIADVVLVPLEDGDRTEALVKMGKKVIAIDLNPLSRTSQKASITIVDNIERAMPLLVKKVNAFRNMKRQELEEIQQDFSNAENLKRCLKMILERLTKLAIQGECLGFGKTEDNEN